MSASDDNYWSFVNFDTGNDLAVLRDCYDISALQHIVKYGYQDDISNNPYYPGKFGYTDRFVGIAARMNDCPDVIAKKELDRDAGILAVKILNEDFSNRRRPTLIVPEMQVKGVMQDCDKVAFETLVKAETPHHVPSVSPKKNNGQTL